MQPDNTVTEQIKAIAARRAARGREILTQLQAVAGHTYTSWLRERARQRLDRPALAHAGRTLSYGQLFDAVDGARQILHGHGVRAGHTVALLMNNSDHYLVWYLAVLGLGAIAVPINNRLVAVEVAYILEHSRSTLVVSEPAYVPVLGQVRAAHGLNLPEIVIAVEQPVTTGQSQRYQEPAPVRADAPAALYYTSGTTGKPKGVVHTHATLMADAMQSPDAWGYEHDNARLLCVTPLFHIAAHTWFFPVLSIGGALYIETYHTESTIRLIEKERITAFPAVPSILLLMVDKARALGVALDSVQTVAFGAAPMTVSRLDDVQALFPNAALVHGMGQTESGGTLVTLPGVAAMARAGSIGIPMAGVQVAIFDLDDKELPRGEVGELVARGPNVMHGYLHDDKASAETLRNGWLHTGDLGFMSEEGLITLADRKKDMIIRGGENIYSSEVEQALLRYPRIKTAAVVGQPHPLFGEEVCAFITTDPHAPQPTVDELLAHCRGQLADYKIPAVFHIIDELPMNSTGKILKAQLRAMLNPQGVKP